MKQYQPVDLYFQPIDSVRYSVTLVAPGNRSATGTIVLPLEDALFNRLHRELLRNTIKDADLCQFGQILYQALLPGELGLALQHIREDPQSGYDKTIRIRLHINVSNSGSLAQIPWEFLFVPGERLPIVLNDTPIVRCIRNENRVVPQFKPPLRMLLSAAIDAPPQIDAERELTIIEAALAPLKQHMTLLIERRLTIEKLEQYLRQDMNIWHFVGHGNLDKQSGSGMLVFQDEQGDKSEVSALTLCTLIAASNLALVVLNACQSGGISRDPLWSIAPTLVQIAAPTVVAMQLPVSQESARVFASAFYRGISQGQAIEVAVNAGRRMLVAQARSLQPDWGIPIVYVPETTNPAIDQSVAGFQAFQSLLQQPAQTPIIRALIGSQATLQLFRDQIGQLRDLKFAHDLLHMIQGEHEVMLGLRPRVDGDQAAWLRLSSNSAQINQHTNQLLELIKESETLRGHERRLAMFGAARDLLRQAIKQRDRNQFEEALNMLQNLIEREPPRLNQSLCDRARDLPLIQLIELLKQIEQQRHLLRLDGSGRDLFDRFLLGLQALSNTSQQLTTLVEQHDRFQEIEIELRSIHIDDEPYQLSVSVQRIWYRSLQPLHIELLQNQSTWSITLKEAIKQIEQILPDKNSEQPQRVSEAFIDYQALISTQFNRIDYDIRSMCDQLITLWNNVNTVLELITNDK